MIEKLVNTITGKLAGPKAEPPDGGGWDGGLDHLVLHERRVFPRQAMIGESSGSMVAGQFGLRRYDLPGRDPLLAREGWQRLLGHREPMLSDAQRHALRKDLATEAAYLVRERQVARFTRHAARIDARLDVIRSELAALERGADDGPEPAGQVVPRQTDALMRGLGLFPG